MHININTINIMNVIVSIILILVQIMMADWI